MSSTLRIAAELTSLAAIRRFVSVEAERLGAGCEATEDMIQALDESATNVIRHGYKGQPGTVEIEVTREGDDLVVQIRDYAPPFDPTTYPSPDVTLPLERRRFGGLGIHLTRECTDAVIYRVAPDGANELTLLKKAF
jgi:anti-sigma regulatory factor (Ser/Thr protein kinase)